MSHGEKKIICFELLFSFEVKWKVVSDFFFKLLIFMLAEEVDWDKNVHIYTYIHIF